MISIVDPGEQYLLYPGEDKSVMTDGSFVVNVLK